MSEGELPPSDEEARWRASCRDTAIRIRIMREEFDKHDPGPELLPVAPERWWSWGASPYLAIAVGVALGLALGFIAALPDAPRAYVVHVVVQPTPPPVPP
jgi:hypothetical protein